MLDTNVVSVLAPSLRSAIHPQLVQWLNQHTAQLFLCAVTIAELTSGAARLRRAGSARKADQLEEWIESVVALYRDRVLPFDTIAARITGVLSEDVRALGLSPGFADLAIAGIAQAQGMILLTRNLRDYASLGIAAQDPYAALPD